MSLIIFCLGLGSIISQFVFLRELHTTFQGNELSLSLILFSWLFGSGIGGLLGFFFSLRKRKSIHSNYLKNLLSLILIFSAFWLFISLFLSRGLNLFLSISPFEILQPGQILLISTIVIVPQTITVGLSFILICSIIQNPIKAYLLEALGAFFAGLLSLILIKYFNNCQIIWTIAIIYTASGLLLLNKKLTYYRLLLIIWASCAILSLAMLSKIEESTQNLRFGPQKLIYSTDSIYANIAIVKNAEYSYSLYENGKLSFSTEDSESIEEWAHMLLLSHATPRKILLIGGGVSGVISEILKHPIKSIDYLEPDKKLIESVLKHIPQSAFYGLRDKKVTIYNQDARPFIKAAFTKYDLIILNLGGPSSLQLNRFYTQEFFEKIKNILSQEGRFCFSFESKEDILAGQLLKYNSCLYKSAKSVFPYLQLIPGERLTLIGSSENIPKINPEELAARFKERDIQSKYFTPYHIKAKLFRQEYIQKRLEENFNLASINRDYYPSGFFYYLGLRGKQSWLNFNRMWELSGKIKMIYGFGCMESQTIALLAYWIATMLILGVIGRKNIVNLSVFSSGFYGIALAIIISLLFQINLGFLYYRLGMIVANFMLGLSLGGILFIYLRKTKLSWERALFLSEIALGIISLLAAFILKDNQLTYFLLTLLAGIIIGFEFGIFYSRKKTITIYILDLSGACLGSLLTGLIFVPVLGIYNTCLLISSAKLITAFFLRIPKR
ncbi:MAG: hypothetical protein Q7J72_08260 [Candidatus Omnitrophota bacterium]|nr:hypothetical protein [Candidatus Omnitrophota bacterium]